jgi:hypothetical protein
MRTSIHKGNARKDFTYGIHRIAFFVQNLTSSVDILAATSVSDLPTFIKDETERPVRERCLKCGGEGTVFVSTFRWSGGMHLSWRCAQCRHVWVTPERRASERQTPTTDGHHS